MHATTGPGIVLMDQSVILQGLLDDRRPVVVASSSSELKEAPSGRRDDSQASRPLPTLPAIVFAATAIFFIRRRGSQA